MLAALLWGCTAKQEVAGKPEKESKVIAKVNGTPITEEDLTFRQQGAHGGKGASQQKTLDDVITEEILYQQGLKVGLDKDPGYKAQIARMERQLANFKRAEITRRFYNTQIASRVEITNQEAQEYYNKNVDQIQTELHLGMIGFSNKEDAEAALKRIRSGEPFKEVAAANASKGMPAGQRPPWDMGFVTWGQIPDEFGPTVYKLKPGEVSDIVSSKRTGFHFFTLLESRKNSKVEFGNFSGLIMARLRDKKIMESFENYVAKLKKDAKIEKF